MKSASSQAAVVCRAPWRPPPRVQERIDPGTERRLGSLLLLMRAQECYRRLGFVRLGDYVVERLGVSYRSAQEWIRTEEALAHLPRAAAAFDAGEITSGHVRLLTRVADPALEAYWVGLARRCSVREFAAAIERSRDATAEEGSEAGGPADAPDDQEERPSYPFELSAPAWLASLWRETVCYIRSLSGQDETREGSLEIVLAEFASEGAGTSRSGFADRLPAAPGDGDLRVSARATRSTDPDAGSRSGASSSTTGSDGADLHVSARATVGAVPGADPGSDAPSSATGSDDGDLHVSAPGGRGTPTVSGAPRTRESGARPDREAVNSETTADSEPGPGAEGDRTTGFRVDARAVDRLLRQLIGERQRQEAALAAHLRAAASGKAYILEGFASLEAYGRDRLGLSARKVYYLLALDRALRSLPGLREAFLSARLTVRQALLVGSVAAAETERAWIERASWVTLRRLEDEVSFWRHLKETRPGVWALLKGGPLPEGIRLVPGQPPALVEKGPFEVGLHVSARSAGALNVGDGLAARRPSLGAGSPENQDGSAVPPGGRPDSTDLPPSPAAQFLAALEADEAAEPLPPRMVRIRMRLSPEVRSMWDDAVERCRAAVRPGLEEWEVFAILLHHFWKVWDNSETRRQRRENPTLQRDGWRCTAPGCRSMGSGRLHEHHVVFRSWTGAVEDPALVTALCAPHHLGLLHQGRMRCSGRAPDALVWAMGIERHEDPFMVFIGDRRIGGVAG